MNKKLREMLKEALLCVEERELEAMNNVALDTTPISSELDEKIVALSRKRRGFFYQATKTIPRRVGFIMAIIVITLALMMSISAIRNPIFKFIVSIYQEFVRIEIDNEKNGAMENIYVLDSLPQGYTLLSHSVSPSLISTIYMSDAGGIIVLDQNSNKNASFTYDNEVIKGAYFINGTEVTHIVKEDKGGSMLVWFLEDCYFNLILQNSIDLDKALELVESLRPIKNQMSVGRDTIENAYLPTYTAGLEVQESEFIGSSLVETVYLREDEELIFSQETANGNFDITVDISTFKGVLYIDDIQIFYNEGNGCSFYTWTRDGYLFSLECYFPLSTDECLKIIKSTEK